MELSLGTEVREEYLRWELGASARKLVEDVMLTQPGENLVITADTSSDRRVVNATAEAAYAAGAIPTVVLYPTRKTAVMEPPPPVAGAIRHADVWIEYAVAYILHTQAYKEALKNGARYICLTGMDAMMMVNTVGRVKYDKLLNLGKLLCEIVQKADKVEVFSPAGTHLVAFNQGRRTRQSGKLADTEGRTHHAGRSDLLVSHGRNDPGKIGFRWRPLAACRTWKAEKPGGANRQERSRNRDSRRV